MNKKIALVTGGTRGLGRGVAFQLLNDGFQVVVVGTKKAEDITSTLEDFYKYDNFFYVQGNIGSDTDRKNIIDTIFNKYGRLDVLVNNAGVAPLYRADILETSEESFDFVLSINVKGTFFLTQYASKKMIESLNTTDSKPIIINISSISAYTASTNRPEYCISKAGISMITLLFADKLAEFEIPVFEIRPGIMDTDMTEKVKDKYNKLIEGGVTPIKRWGTPQDIADLVSLLSLNKLRFSTGEVFNVDGGFHIRRL